MDEKDQKIQEMERELEGLRHEVDTLKRGTSQFQYKAEPSRPGTGVYRYDQQLVPPPKARPLRVAAIVAGCLIAFVALAAALVLLAFTLMNTVDKETTAVAEELLQAIVEQDADRAYALVYPGAMTRDEFDQGFEEMCSAWHAGGGGDAFTLKRTSWSMNSSGGVTEYASVYEVFSGEARFTLRLDRMAHGETTGITGAKLSR